MSGSLEILKSEITNGGTIQVSHMDTLIDHGTTYAGTKQLVVLFTLNGTTSSLFIPSNQTGSAFRVLKNDFESTAYVGFVQLKEGDDITQYDSSTFPLLPNKYILYASGSKFKTAKLLLNISAPALLGTSYMMNSSSFNWVPSIAYEYMSSNAAYDFSVIGDKDGLVGNVDLTLLDNAMFSSDGTYTDDMLPIVIYPNISSSISNQSITLQEYASYKLLTIEELY